MMRLRVDIIILLIPALAAILLWQASGAIRLRPVDLVGADRLAGFYTPEDTIRWSGPHARVALPAGGLPGTLVLRGAVAPGARVRVALGGAAPVELPPGGDTPQLRRYAMLVPAHPDELGWAELTITANPSARIGGRDLGMALAAIALAPVSRDPRWPPLFAWLALASMPTLLAVILTLAGTPRRRAVVSSALVGTGIAWIWATYPVIVYPWLLDLRAFVGEPLIWRWWLAAQIVGMAAWPLSARLLRGMPLAGYPLAKTFGLLFVAWVAWILAIVGIAPFGLPSVIGAALIIAAVAWLTRERRGAGLSRSKKDTGMTRPAWLDGVLAYELLFLGGLFIGIWLRWHGAVGPAITGTEKPMEIAILSAVLRYDHFPPLDPWFAGFSLNYYYLGYVLIAALALLTDAAPALAFNLGFAMVVALTVVGVAYAAHALVALSPGPTESRPRRPARVGVAMLALLGCLGIGSQASALQMIIGSPLMRALDAGQLASTLAQRLAGADRIELSHPTPPSWDGPPFTTITPAAAPSFDWFTPSRALYDDVSLPIGGVERRYAITEFPAFSLYLGDLHPHILAMPFDLLALAVALALIRRAQRSAWPSPVRLHSAGYGMIIGCLYCINSWDVPTYALLGAGALALGLRAGPGCTWRAYALSLAALIGAALLTAMPFLLTFRPPATPVAGAIADMPIIGRLAAALGLAQNHTQIHSFLIIFGLFLIMLCAFLSAGKRGGSYGPAERNIYIILCISAPTGPLLGFPLLFLIPLATLLAVRAWARSAAPGEALAAWAAAVGCLILLVPEVVYIRDHMDGQMSRMITVFKFYYQAWILLGIVAAYATWASLRADRWRWQTWLWATPATLLLAGALTYPIGLLGWAEPWLPAERTLDGFALLARAHPAELAAARWISANVAPQDVVLTGFCNCDYEEVSRTAAISGAQTVLGWMDGHERVWRSGYPAQQSEIATRERDISAIYKATDGAAAQAILDRYKVRYLYLGPVERRIYGPAAAAFARDLAIAFRQGDVTIYRVPPK